MSVLPSLSPLGERRQARLVDARLAVTLATGDSPEHLERRVRRLCEASVDLCVLVDDRAAEDVLRRASDGVRRACDVTGTLFFLGRLPGLALQVAADGVHLGDPDVHPDHARRVVGPDVLIGRAAESAAHVDATGDEDVDVLTVPPEVLAYAVDRASHPFFVSCEDPDRASEAISAGADRIIVHGGLAGDDADERCWELRRELARART